MTLALAADGTLQNTKRFLAIPHPTAATARDALKGRNNNNNNNGIAGGGFLVVGIG